MNTYNHTSVVKGDKIYHHFSKIERLPFTGKPRRNVFMKKTNIK